MTNQFSRFTEQFTQLPKSKLTGKPVLHFAHANGVPSSVYSVLFDDLQDAFTVVYIPILGHDEQGNMTHRIDNHWQQITKQVIDSVSLAKDLHGVPMIGLGHSFGALSTLQAIYERPELFAQAVLMDPPLIMGKASLIWHLTKLLSPKVIERRFNVNLSDKLSPAGRSKHRQDTWASRKEASESLKSKSLFKNFHQQAFDDYIEHGLMEQKDGSVTLTIPKAVEVAVFRNLPSLYWLKPNRPPKVPVTLMIGEGSEFLQHKFPQLAKKRLSIDFVTHQGGHMFPLEHPKSVARMIQDVIAKQSAL